MATDLLQALMLEIVWEFERIYCNINQRCWTKRSCGCSCVEWLPVETAAIGDFKITREVVDFDGWAHFEFAGVKVTTELPGKRLFQYSSIEPDLDDATFIKWWRSALAHLNECDRTMRPSNVKP